MTACARRHRRDVQRDTPFHHQNTHECLLTVPVNRCGLNRITVPLFSSATTSLYSPTRMKSTGQSSRTPMTCTVGCTRAVRHWARRGIPHRGTHLKGIHVLMVRVQSGVDIVRGVNAIPQKGLLQTAVTVVGITPRGEVALVVNSELVAIQPDLIHLVQTKGVDVAVGGEVGGGGKQ